MKGERMGRDQPFDFSDDEQAAAMTGSRNSEFSESGSAISDDLMDQAAIIESGPQARTAAAKSAQQSQTATQARTSTGHHDTPTSMQHKRGNQPR